MGKVLQWKIVKSHQLTSIKKIESYDSITGDREAIRWTWNMLLSVDYSDFFLNFVIIVLINVTLSIGFH